MRFAYYDRLSPARQRIYRESDAIEVLELPVGAVVVAPVTAIRDGLLREDRILVQRGCQALLDALATGYCVPPVRVRVLARRPSGDYGELHGLYEPSEEQPPARVTVWMRTVQRKRVVAFRSFLRTLVHEFLHHLDYEHYKLRETFHTEGFYKRESSLANALFAEVDAARSSERGGDNARLIIR